MPTTDAHAQLAIAHRHLARVEHAWSAPTDWPDLAIYGVYCLEAAVMAAAAHFGRLVARTHWDKRDAAAEFAVAQGLPDVSELLAELNDARKAVAYGDMPLPRLDARQVAADVAAFVEAVQSLIDEAVGE